MHVQADNVPAEGCFKKYERHYEHNVQGMSLEVIHWIFDMDNTKESKRQIYFI